MEADENRLNVPAGAPNAFAQLPDELIESIFASAAQGSPGTRSSLALTDTRLNDISQSHHVPPPAARTDVVGDETRARHRSQIAAQLSRRRQGRSSMVDPLLPELGAEAARMAVERRLFEQNTTPLAPAALFAGQYEPDEENGEEEEEENGEKEEKKKGKGNKDGPG
jgi:hypothetical protein